MRTRKTQVSFAAEAAIKNPYPYYEKDEKKGMYFLSVMSHWAYAATQYLEEITENADKAAQRTCQKQAREVQFNISRTGLAPEGQGMGENPLSCSSTTGCPQQEMANLPRKLPEPCLKNSSLSSCCFGSFVYCLRVFVMAWCC